MAPTDTQVKHARYHPQGGIVNLTTADGVRWIKNRYPYQYANVAASITVQRFHAARRAWSLVRWDCAVMRCLDNARC